MHTPRDELEPYPRTQAVVLIHEVIDFLANRDGERTE